MKTPCNPPLWRRLPACRCRCRCIAALILASLPATSVAAETYELFVGLYEPSTDVDDLAALDLDHDAIMEHLGYGSAEGLEEAEEIYSKGRLPNASNGTTLQSLSTNAEDVMMGSISTTYDTFKNYYGRPDYADKWIQASFDGIETEFDNGNIDFGKFLEGKVAAVRVGTAVLNVWMGVVGRLELASHFCSENPETNRASAEWDGAVALYTGSMSRQAGERGHFLYTLAQTKCHRFGTCEIGHVVAPVNEKMFDAFQAGKAHLQQGNCGEVAVQVRAMKSFMIVPLVQGLLRAVFMIPNHDEVTQVRGAAFATSVLPLLDLCDPGDADDVHDALVREEALSGSFEVVKEALERNYECLGISCADVGGIMNLRGDAYVIGAEACDNVQPVASGVEHNDQPEKDENNSADIGSPPEPATSIAAETREHEPFLGRYEPSTDVDDLAALDLDQRSIVARLAAGTYAGLREAEEIYSRGGPNAAADGNRTTLQSLSTSAEDVVGVASTIFETINDQTIVEDVVGVVVETYETFKLYYGRPDYADRWIQASFDGLETEFQKGNADFSKLDLEGRVAAIRYGTTVLNVWMSVVGRIEVATFFCSKNPSEADAAIAEWDRAVALYTGSLAREDGENGHFLYTLAQIECAKFGTCKEGGMAPVNDRMLDAFKVVKAFLLQQGNCRGVGPEMAKDMKSIMTVPLVQGLLRAMYALDVEGDYRTATQGEGAAFAASLLPLLEDCNPGNADVVRDDLMPGKASSGSFEVVKAALERSYECLGVSCAEVGGILNSRRNGYATRAEACDNVQPVVSEIEENGQLAKDENDLADSPTKPQSSESGSGIFGSMGSSKAALMSGLVFGIVGFIGGAAVTAACKSVRSSKKKAAEVEFVTSSNTSGAADENVASSDTNDAVDKLLFI